MKFKIWLWILEFKLKRVADDKKIEFLAKELLKEVEGQGYSLKGTNAVYCLDLNIHTSSNDLSIISGIGRNKEICCGKYSPKLEEK